MEGGRFVSSSNEFRKTGKQENCGIRAGPVESLRGLLGIMRVGIMLIKHIRELRDVKKEERIDQSVHCCERRESSTIN